MYKPFPNYNLWSQVVAALEKKKVEKSKHEDLLKHDIILNNKQHQLAVV